MTGKIFLPLVLIKLVKVNNMSRRNARKHIFNLVFQTEFNNDIDIDESVNTYIAEYSDFEKSEREFILNEYKGIKENLEEIDNCIDSLASGWSISRLAKTDLAILRIAVYEILYSKEIPDKVAANEAVELAKLFSGDKGPAFVNGVLSKVIKSRKDGQ